MNDTSRQHLIDLATDPDEAMERTVTELAAGGIVVIPTDTIYGIAAVASDQRAVASIFHAKARPAERRIAVLVADLQQAHALVVPSSAFTTLAAQFWPGPLTLVAQRAPSAPVAVGDESTIGVRCPDDPFVRTLAHRVGPLATTSANAHGAAPATEAVSVAAELPMIATVIDGGPRSSSASTVVDVSRTPPVVLRVGSLSADRIGEALNLRL